MMPLQLLDAQWDWCFSVRVLTPMLLTESAPGLRWDARLCEWPLLAVWGPCSPPSSRKEIDQGSIS
jgi:hypothetical protein